LEIKWKGNEHTNSSSRQKYVPFVIVNHISVGTMSSMDYWFTDPNNKVSSAHFGVAKDGSIHQYVAIERMAWTQGITEKQINNATAQVVRDMGVNPNLYSVSIEHEGYDGDLTKIQFEASIWLHQYIKDYIGQHWGKTFPLDDYHVIGHYQVNPTEKPYCPGPQFPWEQLYATLAELDKGGEEEMEELKRRLAQLEEQNAQLQTRIERLERYNTMPAIPDWAKKSVDKAVKTGLILNPKNGSYDFYRFLVVLDKKGLI
jgi:N-acetylmuramoyl-L-alanine amidase